MCNCCPFVFKIFQSDSSGNLNITEPYLDLSEIGYQSIFPRGEYAQFYIDGMGVVFPSPILTPNYALFDSNNFVRDPSYLTGMNPDMKYLVLVKKT